MTKILGIDIGSAGCVCVLLSERPGDLREFLHKCKPIKIDFNQEGIEALLALDFDIAVIEPTGMHYSKLVSERIEQTGREIRWVGHIAIANHRKSNRLPNKNDTADALATADYTLAHLDKPNYFVHPVGLRIKLIMQEMESLNRIKSPVINRIRQQLAHEWPERAKKTLLTREFCKPPGGILAFLAGNNPRNGAVLSRMLDKSAGKGLSPFTRNLSKILCEIERAEMDLEIDLDFELNKPEFKPYLEAFSAYGISVSRTAGTLLAYIYPIEKFLTSDGKQKSRYINGAKRNLSLSAFKLSLGMGLVQHQSGQSEQWKPGGSALARQALWRWAKIAIVMKWKTQERSERLVVLREIYELHKGKRENHRLSKVMSKFVQMLWKDLMAQTRS